MLPRSAFLFTSLLFPALALAATAPAAHRAAAPAAALPAAVVSAAAGLDGRGIEAHIRYLADDLLEGRGTGTRGYDLAARYVAARMLAMGLEPAGSADTSYFQPVPFLSGRVDGAQSSFALVRDGKTQPLALGTDLVLSPDLLRDKWTTDAGLVFAGYGVSAPELGYDDFANVDATGKVLVTFRGAPPRFDHDQRAYYSNGTVKEQIAAAHGAIGVITILRPEDEKRLQWDRVVRQSRLPGMRWTDAGGAPANTQALLTLSGSCSHSGMVALFAGAPRPLEQVFADADSSRPQSFALPSTVHAVRVTTREHVASPNVVGFLRGSDPKLANECVVLTAHLDHLGISTPVQGDSINNGAYDNGSGTAMMLEVARLMAGLPKHPRRSLLFVSVCGEEKGLQGSDYFARHDAPRGLRIVADINLDEVLLLGPVTHVIGFGAEHSSLGGQLERAAKLNGLTLMPDPRPEEVVFVRSDQFSFVKQGIPGIFPVAGGDGSPSAAAAASAWDQTRYHSPSDDMTQVFDWASGARFTRMAFEATWIAADSEARPHWNDGDYFGRKFGPKP